jgi:hypothetical protein
LHIGLIGRFSLCQQIGHFRLELRFDLASMLVGQRAVSAGIGVDLGAIQRHRTHLQHPHFTGQFQPSRASSIRSRHDLGPGSGVPEFVRHFHQQHGSLLLADQAGDGIGAYHEQGVSNFLWPIKPS